MRTVRPRDHAASIAEHDPLPVTAWRDPLYDQVGFDPRSDYVETYWLVVLGPSAVLAARRLVDWLEERPDGLEVPLEALARSLGLGASTARHAPVVRTLTRLADFGLAGVGGGAYQVRTAFPPLAQRHVVRLPEYLAERHALDAAKPPVEQGCGCAAVGR